MPYVQGQDAGDAGMQNSGGGGNKFAEFGVDFIFAGSMEKLGNFDSQNGVSLRTHNTIFFRSNKSAQLGVVCQFEKPDDIGYEAIIGAGLRFGFNYFFEADAGYLFRHFRGYNESGIGIVVQFGKYFPLSSKFKFKVSLPVVTKIITSGLVQKTIIDYVPYFGLAY
ncbi:MAG: hypothetical protein JXA66_08310, partial [Oligoflexia bacterium]|nr:hypothetical protein [Oligoflexia bacterium]